MSIQTYIQEINSLEQQIESLGYTKLAKELEEKYPGYFLPIVHLQVSEKLDDNGIRHIEYKEPEIGFTQQWTEENPPCEEAFNMVQNLKIIKQKICPLENKKRELEKQIKIDAIAIIEKTLKENNIQLSVEGDCEIKILPADQGEIISINDDDLYFNTIGS